MDFDNLLYKAGMAEDFSNGSVSVVKTHYKFNNAMVKSRFPSCCDKAILLIRHPLKAFISEFNRKNVKTHVDAITINSKDKEWAEFIKRAMPRWLHLYYFWMKNINTSSLLVIQYADLLTNTENELRRLMSFLNLNFTEANMKCTLERKEGLFHRKHHQDEIISDLYTQEMKTEIGLIVDIIQKKLQNLHLMSSNITLS